MFIRKTTNIRTDISYENFSELNKKNKISERRIIYIKQIKLERNYKQKKKNTIFSCDDDEDVTRKYIFRTFIYVL